jgi:hypothetical protein
MRSGAHPLVSLLIVTLPLLALVTPGCWGTNLPSRILGATGGSSATTGEGGAGGTTDDAGASDMFSPLCSDVPLTAAGVAPSKGVTCTPDDPQLCYKTCGPFNIGFKSETCSGTTYAEMTGCSFPPGDYSCYRIPTSIAPSCPADPPKAGDACTVGECVLCNVGGGYFDSKGSAKTGYCICPPPDDEGTRQWSCASDTAWPCPTGLGC